MLSQISQNNHRGIPRSPKVPKSLIVVSKLFPELELTAQQVLFLPLIENLTPPREHVPLPQLHSAQRCGKILDVGCC